MGSAEANAEIPRDLFAGLVGSAEVLFAQGLVKGATYNPITHSVTNIANLQAYGPEGNLVPPYDVKCRGTVFAKLVL